MKQLPGTIMTVATMQTLKDHVGELFRSKEADPEQRVPSNDSYRKKSMGKEKNAESDDDEEGAHAAQTPVSSIDAKD